MVTLQSSRYFVDYDLYKEPILYSDTYPSLPPGLEAMIVMKSETMARQAAFTEVRRNIVEQFQNHLLDVAAAARRETLDEINKEKA